MVEAEGFEAPSKPQKQPQKPIEKDPDSSEVSCLIVNICPDLSRIIKSWTSLPPKIKQAILAIVDLSKGGGADE